MKQYFLLGVGAVLVFLFVFFVGTRPAPEEKKEEAPVIQSKKWDKAPEMKIDPGKQYFAAIKTSKGDMKVELFPKDAPLTVNNFVFLSREGFYDGVIFHRIIKDFMIQGGDPTGTGTGGPGYKFADEKVARDYKRGTLAMANAGPNTNGSQFFIMTKDNTTLPKNYTIFGMINPSDMESLKALDTIAATPIKAGANGELSQPTEEVKMFSVTIE